MHRGTPVNLGFAPRKSVLCFLAGCEMPAHTPYPREKKAMSTHQQASFECLQLTDDSKLIPQLDSLGVRVDKLVETLERGITQLGAIRNTIRSIRDQAAQGILSADPVDSLAMFAKTTEELEQIRWFVSSSPRAEDADRILSRPHLA